MVFFRCYIRSPRLYIALEWILCFGQRFFIRQMVDIHINYTLLWHLTKLFPTIYESNSGNKHLALSFYDVFDNYKKKISWRFTYEWQKNVNMATVFSKLYRLKNYCLCVWVENCALKFIQKSHVKTFDFVKFVVKIGKSNEYHMWKLDIFFSSNESFDFHLK